jgi:hypothetical protein
MIQSWIGLVQQEKKERRTKHNRKEHSIGWLSVSCDHPKNKKKSSQHYTDFYALLQALQCIDGK